MRLAAGLCPNPLGELKRFLIPTSRYKGERMEGRGRKEIGIGRDRKGREGKDVKG